MRAFWLAPHRPFFLLAGLWAAVAPLAWLIPGLAADPRFWHMHELMFGMGGAAAGGYLLTALPGWTGRPPHGGGTLQGLVALWLLARVAAVGGTGTPAALVAPAYFAALGLLLTRDVAAARAWAKLPLALAPLALGLLDATVAGGWAPGGDPGAAPRAAALMFSAMIALVGGRAVPAFTRSWLTHRGLPGVVRAPAPLAALAAAMILAAAGLTLAGWHHAAGGLLAAAGATQIARQMFWQPLRAAGSGALAMLHGAWAWHGLGLLLAGTALAAGDAAAQADAIHAITMGAMGTMILALAGRAAMIRQPGELAAPPILALGFLLVSAAAVRVALPPVDGGPDPVRLSALLWIGGWVAFLAALGPALGTPATRPVLSAARPPDNPA